eukprot:144405-Ditylum_brightwellii.AAC.1
MCPVKCVAQIVQHMMTVSSDPKCLFVPLVGKGQHGTLSGTKTSQQPFGMQLLFVVCLSKDSSYHKSEVILFKQVELWH